MLRRGREALDPKNRKKIDENVLAKKKTCGRFRSDTDGDRFGVIGVLRKAMFLSTLGFADCPSVFVNGTNLVGTTFAALVDAKRERGNPRVSRRPS
jgi:hypothetical protein